MIDAITLGSRGLVEYEGIIEALEEIPQDSLKSFAESKKGVLGDLRLIGSHVDDTGKRFIGLPDAFPLLKETAIKDWGFSGPRAVKEYLQHHLIWLHIT